MNIRDIFLAFAGGLFSFLSPCIMPLLPGYLAIITGAELEDIAENRRSSAKTMFAVFLFCGGFTITFTALALTAFSLGKFLLRYSRIIEVFAGLLIITFALTLLGIFNSSVLNKNFRLPFEKIKAGYLSPLFMGMAFALGWSPCVGPVLGGFLAMSAVKSTAAQASVLLLFYSLGLSVPFIMAGLAAHKILPLMSKYRKTVVYGKKLAGAVLLIIGVILIMKIKTGFFAPI